MTLLNEGYNSTCPDYSDLLELDNSDRKISGDFVKNENGVTLREKPNLKNSWRIYDHSTEWLVFIDAPAGYSERMKTITIHPNFDTYTLTKDNIVENYTRIIYHDRFVNDECTHAIINADKWQLLIADTIFFMRENCNPIKTSFNHIELIPIELMDHDITTSQKYKDEQRLKEILKHCIFKFKSCS